MKNAEIIAPYFKPDEFKCDGEPCLENMDPNFLGKLVELRERCGIPFILNSTYRSPAKNRQVGGAPDSMHLLGRAVDIHVPGGAARWLIVQQATHMGLSVGIMEKAVHVDDRSGPVMFHYYDKYRHR
jgi:uncharacterized protein YcbK (DUF882 family)